MRVHGARRVSMAVVAASVIAVAGCSSSGSSSKNTDGATTTIAPDALAKQCDLSAFESAKKPVQITYWHEMTRQLEDELKKLTAKFNSSQNEVRVTLRNQQSYEDALTKFKTVAGQKDSPDLLQIQDIDLQQMIDSQSIVPAQACINATKTDISDILPRAKNYYTVAGTLYPMPFNVSNPVLYYNKEAFKKAGLDTEKPPTTLDEVAADAKILREKGGLKYGFYYKRDSWILEQFLALNGETYVNNGNGREQRATKTTFNSPTALDIFTTLQKIVKDGDAATNPSDGPSNFDNLLSICNGENAMTIDTSAALGTALAVLNSGGCKAKVDVGIAPMPTGNGQGGALVGGAANYIAKTDPIRQVAAWKFAQFLTTPESQAEWATTGYIPISAKATSDPLVTGLWAKTPGYKVAYEQLTSGKENAATAGPVIGGYSGVRAVMKSALEELFIQMADPKQTLDKAQAGADAAISEYNSRV